MFFEKYHGLGNDFVITTYEEVEGKDCTQLARSICNRHTGIGADGFIIVKQSPTLEMLYYNADGTIAPMCGNGIRCFALYVYNNIHQETSYDVLTGAGTLKVNVTSTTPFITTINMGRPVYDGKAIPLTDKYSHYIDMPIQVDGDTYFLTALFMATTHSVVFVQDLDNTDTEKLGVEISNNPMFPEKTNVNFVEVIDRNTIKMVTYERGCGITYACGSGACASAVVAKKLELCDENIKVVLPLGDLHIDVLDDVFLRGNSERVFKGEYFYD